MGQRTLATNPTSGTMEQHYELDSTADEGVEEALLAATDRKSGQRVSITLLTVAEAAQRAFEDVVSKLSEVRHPNVARILRTGRNEQGRTYVAYEHIEGKTLIEALDVEPRMSVQDLGRLVAGVLDGLHAAHEAGVIHGDVSPEMIRVESSGRAKLIGFGFEKARAKPIVSRPFHYRAPEQRDGGELSRRTDLYGVGAMIYHALSGLNPHQPLPGSTEREARSAAPLGKVRPEVNGTLARAIDRALRSDPNGRFSTALAMRRAVMSAIIVAPRIGGLPIAGFAAKPKLPAKKKTLLSVGTVPLPSGDEPSGPYDILSSSDMLSVADARLPSEDGPASSEASADYPSYADADETAGDELRSDAREAEPAEHGWSGSSGAAEELEADSDDGADEAELSPFGPPEDDRPPELRALSSDAPSGAGRTPPSKRRGREPTEEIELEDVKVSDAPRETPGLFWDDDPSESSDGTPSNGAPHTVIKPTLRQSFPDVRMPKATSAQRVASPALEELPKLAPSRLPDSQATAATSSTKALALVGGGALVAGLLLGLAFFGGSPETQEPARAAPAAAPAQPAPQPVRIALDELAPDTKLVVDGKESGSSVALEAGKSHEVTVRRANEEPWTLNVSEDGVVTVALPPAPMSAPAAAEAETAAEAPTEAAPEPKAAPKTTHVARRTTRPKKPRTTRRVKSSTATTTMRTSGVARDPGF